MFWRPHPPNPRARAPKENPYEISTEDELFWFAGLINGTLTDGTAKNTATCAVPTADINIPISYGGESSAITATGEIWAD